MKYADALDECEDECLKIDSCSNIMSEYEASIT